MTTARPSATRSSAASRTSATNARGAASRARILEAATAVLRERGYAGLSIASVCERADIAPTSVYWHFDNKAGLMTAVLAHVSGEFTDQIREAVDDGDNKEDKLDALLDGMCQLAMSQPLGSLTGVSIIAEGRHVDPELLDTLHTARHEERHEVADAFQNELEIDSRFAETLAITATALANYAAICSRLGETDEEVRRIIDALGDILRLVDHRSSTDSR